MTETLGCFTHEVNAVSEEKKHMLNSLFSLAEKLGPTSKP
jgi:hypothetical protein